MASLKLDTLLALESLVTTDAVVIREPGQLALERLRLDEAGPADVVVENHWSGVSAGTERLLWTGAMPSFPGMGYPLVPGYESVGVVTWAGPESGRSVGDQVYVPGASCYGEVKGLFGASAQTVMTTGARTVPTPGLGQSACLLALAATAYRALSAGPAEIIVGHGALGRLLARLNKVRYGVWPAVWETRRERRSASLPYDVVAPGSSSGTAQRAIDASGDPAIVDQLVPHMARSGEVVLAGFYAQPVSFHFPGAFIKELTVRISAEFGPSDLAETTGLALEGALDLEGIITHVTSPSRAGSAYETAFEDPECIKLILDWNDNG